MKNKFFIKGFLCYAVMLARLHFPVLLVLASAGSGVAKMVEEPRSFSLRDKSQEQVERKILPKDDKGRLLAEGQARGKDPQPPGQPAVEIGKVNQGYRGLGQVGIKCPRAGCEIDAACLQGNPQTDPWSNQRDAVGLMDIGSIHKACTGTLLNSTGNTATNKTPYFLTARHCFEWSCRNPPCELNHLWEHKLIIYWNYNSTTASVCASPYACSNGTCAAPFTCPNNGPSATPPCVPASSTWANQTMGAKYVTDDRYNDLILLQLNSPPPNAYYAGWDANTYNIAPVTPVVGIHHPGGDEMAISQSVIPANNPVVSADKCSGGTNANGNFWRVHWQSGITEEGSSGSCLFDANKRCVGQLNNGAASDSPGGTCPQPPLNSCVVTNACLGTYYSWYGKLNESYLTIPALKAYLDPGTPPKYFNDGDPHITTADGVHYNFQGAGEYVSLRNSSGLEIQTRQTPIATTFNPGADPHDGLATCVSLNTAVASQVGKHRVTYEPNLSGVPDPRGLQLRVDGKLTKLTRLGRKGRNLESGGRIAKSPVPGGLEIDFPDASALFVTPGWWASQRKWYLNVDILRHLAMDGTAGGGTDGGGPDGGGFKNPSLAKVSVPLAAGIEGAVPPDSWLPALPDGTPVPLPPSYAGLYNTFGEAWRVNEKTNPSLFDYARGTSTETFTLPSCASTDSEKGSEKCWPPEIPPDWPPDQPRCLLAGTKPARPVSEPVAQEACRQITGKNILADCIFDVRVTGNPGFAQTYLRTQQLQNGATETTIRKDRNPTKYGRIKYGRSVTFTATVALVGSRGGAAPAGSVQFTVDGSNAGNPVALDPKGRAVWSTSRLRRHHRISATYIPGPNSVYLASVSPYESYVVLKTYDRY